MNQPIIVTLYDQAAQVRWILHAACAATFALAMGLLALRLRRPLMRTIAAVWVWQLVIALNLVAYFYWRTWFTDHVPIRVLGTLALHLPSLVMAPLLRRLRETLEDGEEFLDRAPVRVAPWALAGAVTTVLFELARSAWPDAATTLTFSVSRAIAVVPYLYALWPRPARAGGGPDTAEREAAAREAGFATEAFRFALGLRAVVIGVDFVVRVIPWQDSMADGLTVFVVLSNLVGLVAFGTILLFVALENERTAVMRQTAALHAAELRAAHSQRLESLGRLASGVAHDFNNVLAVVVGASGEAARHLPKDAPIRPDLDAIEAAGRQGMALTRQLLDYARQRPAGTRRFVPADVVRTMAPICDRLVTAPGRIAWMLSATAPLQMDASQFEQVVMNLVVNARDAMEAAPGTITVSLADESVGTGSAPARLAPGAYVRLSVADTGCGIPAELLPSIFEPFVTTKEARGGTGLGLATVQHIARATGGDVAVESAVGQGTTVRVWFAAAAAAA